MRAAAAVALLLSGTAWAGPSMTSGSNTIQVDAGNAGGGYSSSGSGATNSQLTGSVAEEVAITTMATAAARVRAGFSELQSWPGPIAALYISSVSLSSATLQWATPGYDGSLGALAAGTTYFINIASYTAPDTFAFISTTTDVMISTSGMSPGALATTAATALLPNTSWYVQIWTKDADADLSPPFRSTITTLAAPPNPGALTFLSVQTGSASANGVMVGSVTVAWAALPQSPPDASSKTCEGYVLYASSNDFGVLGGSAPVFSSATASVLASTLTVGASGAPLDLSNTYYFQVASLNWAGQPNYTPLGRLNFQIAQSTNEINFAISDVVLSTVATSSMVITNVGNWPATIELAASTATPGGSPWTLSTSSGYETAALLGVWYAGAVAPPPTAFSTFLTTTTRISQGGAGGDYVGTQNGYELAPGASATLWFQFFAPWSTTSLGPERIQVIAQPVYP